jgi:hypothetical protein
MTKRAAPLLADRLPLYATDAELRAVIFGERASDPICVSAFESMTNYESFPRFRATMGGRHVPLVINWIEEYEASRNAAREFSSEEQRAAVWNKSKRRA